MKIKIIFLITLFFFSGLLFTQQIKIKQISLKNFPEIELRISIESKFGVPVPVDTKLLRLFEKENEIKNFTVKPFDTVKVPIYTAIILDKSGSMKGKAIIRAKEGAIEFVKMMKGNDKAAYVEFDTKVSVAVPFASDKGSLINRMKKTVPGGDTAILDALFKGIELLKNEPEKSVKIVLLLTDGRENRSTKKIEEVLNLAKEAGVSIFTIGLGNKVDEKMLLNLSGKTEANYYNAPAPKDLLNIYKKISLLLHSQLIVKFSTPYPMDDKWHNLKLTVSYMESEITGEKGYLSAKESKIPTELLKRIRNKENERIEKSVNKRETPKKEKEKKKLILILLIALVFLSLVLLTILIKRRR